MNAARTELNKYICVVSDTPSFQNFDDEMTRQELFDLNEVSFIKLIGNDWFK